MADEKIPLLLEIINDLAAVLPASDEKLSHELAELLAPERGSAEFVGTRSPRGGDNYSIRFDLTGDTVAFVEFRGRQVHDKVYFVWIQLLKSSHVQLKNLVQVVDAEFSQGVPADTSVNSDLYMVQAKLKDQVELVCMYEDKNKLVSGIRLSVLEPDRKYSAATPGETGDIKAFASFISDDSE